MFLTKALEILSPEFLPHSGSSLNETDALSVRGGHPSGSGSAGGCPEIWLARHGNRVDFVDREWALTAERPYDPGLSVDGLIQAQRLGERLAGSGIREIYASPFLRTVQTANAVAEALDLPIFLEPGLSEWLNPEWFFAPPEPISPELMRNQYPRVDPGYNALMRPQYPETEAEALNRSAEAARRLGERRTAPILLVGHAMSVAGGVMGLATNVRSLDCPLCSLFKLERSQAKWQLVLCSDVGHLGEATGKVTIHDVR